MIVILAAPLLIAIWAIITAYELRKDEKHVEERRSSVETALAKRYDMLKKMLSTAKDHMKHEEGIFDNVIELPRNMSVEELNDACRKVDSLSGRFFDAAKRYPNLCKSEEFTDMQRDVDSAQQEFEVARRHYNSDVVAYNASLSVFPAEMVARNKQRKRYLDTEKKTA